MGLPLRVLIVEDSEDDAILMLHELRRAGYEPTSERVDMPQAMNAALDQQTWDIVLSDYAMPRFSMPAALAMVKEKGLDLPFIIVSGAIGEETAVAAMRAGAHDYIMKDNLARLAPAVERELREAEVRRERKRMEEELQRNYDTQSVINSLLSLSLEDIPIEELLGRALNLILSIPWLAFESRGGVSLVQDEPNMLVMKAQNALAEPIQKACARVPFGRCLCGRAASTQQIQFADCLDERHLTRYEGISPHGHYCVPIVHAGKVLGVLNMYLREGHRLNRKEVEFLGAVANALAGIIQRKQVEEALRKSEEMLRRYLESSPDAIYVNDLKGTFLYGNRAAETMIGYTREELIGKNFLEVAVLPAEYLSKAAQNLELNAAGIPTGPDEFELIRKDGSRVFIEISTYPTGQGDGIEIIGIARDITERKRMEQQLHLAGRLAAVGELAAGVAHELNNPLAAVQMYAELLNDRDDLEEAIKSDVETIYTQAQRASRITGNLLSFARRHEPEKRLISINQVIEKALELHAYRMKVNNIDLVTELDPHLPMTMADFHQMQQVFVNIINNAEQAMTEAHGRGKLCVKTQKVDKMIRIAFTDDGPGISEENQQRMFDPFFTTKEVGRGTGLGLSICYGLVQEHGGHMSVRSKPGGGATFVVEIPIVSEDQRTAQETNPIQGQEI